MLGWRGVLPRGQQVGDGAHGCAQRFTHVSDAACAVDDGVGAAGVGPCGGSRGEGRAGLRRGRIQSDGVSEAEPPCNLADSGSIEGRRGWAARL